MRLRETQKITLTALLTAVSLILGWIEHIVPLTGNIPYIKLGISNIAVIFAVYILGTRYSAALVCAKVTLSAILFGGFSGFAYSAAGGLLSLTVMLLLRKSKSLSPVGVSAAAGGAHMLAQICIAALLTSTPRLIVTLFPLSAVGIITGALTGFAASLILRAVRSLGIECIQSNSQNASCH